jgi:hypothetical protein
MDIQITFAQQGSAAGYAIFNIYDPTALNTVIDSKIVALPQTGFVVNFTNLPDQTYVVKTFKSLDTNWQHGVQIGNDFYAYPGVNSTVGAVREDLEVIADQTTGFASGQNSYIDTSFVDWKYSFELVGSGTQQPGVDYNKLVTGGIQMINGYLFQPNEKLIFHFLPNVSTGSTGGGTAGSAFVAGKIFSDMVTITTDTVLDATYMGKIINLQSIGSSLVIDLPELADVPDNQLIPFQSNGGNHIMATIRTSANFSWLGESRQSLYLGQSESFTLFKNGNFWYVLFPDGNFKTVGEIVDSYTLNKLNCVLCDGSELSRVLYPRLWEWVQNTGKLIEDSQWKFGESIEITKRFTWPYIGYFSYGSGGVNGTTFRLPLLVKTKDALGNLISGGFIRGIGTPNTFVNSGAVGISNSAENEIDGVGDFEMDLTGIKTRTGGGSQLVVSMDNGGNYQGTDGNQSVTYDVKAKQWNGVSFIETNETRPMSIGLYRMIRY